MTSSASAAEVRFSPRWVRMVVIPSPDNSRAARSASSIRSPGMKRDTERRTNPYRVAWSRSHGLVDPASSAFRIKLMVNPSRDWGLGTGAGDKDRGLGFRVQGSPAGG